MTRFLFSVSILLVGLVSLVNAYSGGSGTSEDPYQIATAQDLIDLGNEPNDYDKNFVLTADIDLSGQIFDRAVIAPDKNTNSSRIKFRGVPFSGRFDGQGHIIRHLNISGRNYVGLFGQSEGAEIVNIGLEEVEIYGVNDVGALVGCNVGHGRDFQELFTISGIISSCHSTGTVKGSNNVGGLVGCNSHSRILSCYSTCITVGTINVGGVVGGSVGYSVSTFGVHCHPEDTISLSYSSGSVHGKDNVGGLVGQNVGSIKSCYSTGTVNGEDNVGGLVGKSRSDMYGSSYIQDIIFLSYSTCVVIGHQSVGGLVGFNSDFGHIWSCYSSGTVCGESNAGGLVGNDGAERWWDYPGIVTASLWDTQTSGQTNSKGGIGLNTSQMHDISTYLNMGWDLVGESENGTCNFWYLEEKNYPKLSVLSGVIPVEPNGAGTQESPYQIIDVNELGSIWYRPRAHYRMMADIDLSSITWSNAVVPWFYGCFDGNGYSIRFLHIVGVERLGLFGTLETGALVTDLGNENVLVNGYFRNIGGLVGRNIDGHITSCFSTGTVIGSNMNVSTISSQLQRIIPLSSTGGLVGSNSGTISKCYSDGSVHSEDFSCVGGLVGFNTGPVSLCCNTCVVTGGESVGGLVGCNNNGSVSNSYNTGTVYGRNKTGGLVGFDFNSSISFCYNASAVRGENRSGGLVGDYTIFLRSEGSFQPNITSSFWDIEVSEIIDVEGDSGLSTINMQDINTFLNAGWDFVDESDNGTEDIWWIPENSYPLLWWQDLN